MIVHPITLRRGRRQRGYSLVELLIAMTVSVIATAAAVLLITKFARSAGAYAEVSTLEETRATAESVMRSDFDGAGFNLTRASMPNAGKQNVLFLSSPDFSSSTPGTLLKLNNNSAVAYAANAVSSGISLWSWTPANICRYCSAGIQGGDLYYDAINTYADGSPNPGIIYIFESRSGYVASNAGLGVPIANHMPGDSYQIGIEAPNQLQQNRFVRYYRVRAGVRTIIYTSHNPIPSSPHYLFASINNAGETINGISVIGAPIEYRANNQTEFARLPFVGGTQLVGPITIVSGIDENGRPVGTSAIVLSGDKSTDTSPALSVFTGNSTQIDIKTPKRGTYSNGDTILVTDYGNTDPSNPLSPATAACIVTSVSNPDSVTTRLTVTRATQTAPALGGLWSSDTDHAHTFAPAQTIVVKLAPPVTYAVSTDARLVRVEGYRVSTVALNVRQFTVTQSGVAPAQCFSVTAALAAEGVETANDTTNESRSTIEFTSTPRAMNLASNRMN